MIKLIDLLEIEVQPGERSKMKNFLYRGTKTQIAQMSEYSDEFIMEPYDDQGSTTYSKMKGVIESGMLQTDHPENKERTVGWDWDEPNTLEEDLEKIKQSLLGREMQTLQDVKKIIARLKARGFALPEIYEYITEYLEGLDEGVGYAMITKPAVSGGLTQKTK